MTTPRRLLPSFLLAVAAMTAACGSAAAPSTGPSGDPGPSAAPSQNAVDLPASVEPGGGSSGNTGSGIVDPGVPVDPNDPSAGGQAKLVRPKPGQKDPHPVAVTKLESSVEGRHVLVKLSWYSGIEPCSVLDSVKVERSRSEISLTPLEGIGDPDAVCIEIAVLKATIVDLGELEAGTWRIVATSGDAPPLEVTIS